MGWSVPDEKREEFSGRVTGNSELSFQGACDSPGEDPTALLNGCPQEIASARRIEVNHLADTTASEGKDSFTDPGSVRSEEHTSELQSRQYLVCRLLLEKKKKKTKLTIARISVTREAPVRRRRASRARCSDLRSSSETSMSAYDATTGSGTTAHRRRTRL